MKCLFQVIFQEFWDVIALTPLFQHDFILSLTIIDILKEGSICVKKKPSYLENNKNLSLVSLGYLTNRHISDPDSTFLSSLSTHELDPSNFECNASRTWIHSKISGDSSE